MIAGKSYIPLKTDIWSCGVILYAMVCGFLPFEDPNTPNLYKKIMSGTYTKPNHLSTDVIGILRRILDVKPDTRASISQIRSHRWMQQTEYVPTQGIIVGTNQIPINHGVLAELESYGINHEKMTKQI